MYISKRVKVITLLFIESRENLSVKEIASRLELSERTVYRELEGVRSLLKSYNLELTTIPNEGMLLQGKIENISKLEDELMQESHIDNYKIEERVELETLKIITESSFIKWEAVSSYIDVSLSTSKKDQNLIRQFLKKRNLILISKMGEGIRIDGKIYHKHITIMDILVKNVEFANLFKWLKDNDLQKSIFLKIMNDRYDNSCQEAFKIVKKIILSDEGDAINDIDLIEFIILFGCWIRELILDEDLTFDQEIKHVSDSERQLCHSLLGELDYSVPDEWRNYLSWLIQIYFGDQKSNNQIRNQRFTNKVKLFIQNVEEQLGIKLMENLELFTGLQNHLVKAVNRVNTGVSIRNPLNREIKQNYQSLYAIVTNSVNKVFGLNFFPNDEIGFLVLYVAVALDKLVDKSFRVLIVCSSGMGSSKMLANRLEREIPEVYVKRLTSLMELRNIELDEYELILSTVPLYLKRHEYMQVSPLLNENEIQIIRQKIENHKYTSLALLQSTDKSASRKISNKSIDQLYEFYKSSKYAVDLLKTLDLKSIKINSHHQLKNEILDMLLRKNFLSSSSAEIASADWSQNYFHVPNKKYAILNCPTTKNISSLLVIDVEYQTADEQLTKVIVIVHPAKANQKSTALLSNLIISLITNEEADVVIRANDFELLQQFFAEELRCVLNDILL